MVSLTAGLAYFTQVSVGGSYVGDLLPGFLLAGRRDRLLLRADLDRRPGRRPALPRRAWRPACSTPRSRSAGRWASRRCPRSRRSRTDDAVAAGTALPVALVDGFSAAFTAGVVVAALGIVAALTLIRSDELESAPEVEPELELAA